MGGSNVGVHARIPAGAALPPAPSPAFTTFSCEWDSSPTWNQQNQTAEETPVTIFPHAAALPHDQADVPWF